MGLRFLGCDGLRDASDKFRRECQTQGSSEGPLAFALAKFVVGNEGQSRMDVDSKLDLILFAFLGEAGLTDGSQTSIDIRSRIQAWDQRRGKCQLLATDSREQDACIIH